MTIDLPDPIQSPVEGLPAIPLDEAVACDHEHSEREEEEDPDLGDLEDVVDQFVDYGCVHTVAERELLFVWEGEDGAVEAEAGEGPVDLGLERVEGLFDPMGKLGLGVSAFHGDSQVVQGLSDIIQTGDGRVQLRQPILDRRWELNVLQPIQTRDTELGYSELEVEERGDELVDPRDSGLDRAVGRADVVLDVGSDAVECACDEIGEGLGGCDENVQCPPDGKLEEAEKSGSVEVDDELDDAFQSGEPVGDVSGWGQREGVVI